MGYKSGVVLTNQENGVLPAYLMRQKGADKITVRVLEALWERKGDGTPEQDL